MHRVINTHKIISTPFKTLRDNIEASSDGGCPIIRSNNLCERAPARFSPTYFDIVYYLKVWRSGSCILSDDIGTLSIDKNVAVLDR
jgi:hypothetical protein